MEQQVNTDHPVVAAAASAPKVAALWTGVGVASYLEAIGIHNWGDLAGVLASFYSLILICEWLWKKRRARKDSKRAQRGGASPRVLAALAAAVAVAVPAEGLRRWAYYDPPGILTVCYGHTGPDVVKGREYSMAECKQMLTADMLKAVESVERCAPGLPPNVLAAFSDAVFNLGPNIACNPAASTAARMLQAKQYREACLQLPRWNKATIAGVLSELPGLTKRRNEEMRLCLS